MRALFFEPVHRLAGVAPLVVRIVVGVIMAAHGWQKIQAGPANFGLGLAELGVPLPTVMAYLVTLVELVGGILLIVGLLSRLAALLLTIDLVMAILLVKVNVGFLSPQDGGGRRRTRSSTHRGVAGGCAGGAGEVLCRLRARVRGGRSAGGKGPKA